MAETTHSGRGAPSQALPVPAAPTPERGTRRAGARARIAARAFAGLGLTAGLALVLTLAGCGESSQEKAAKSVCAARSDIKQRISALEGLTPSIASLPQIKTEASAIAKDLEKIKDAQPDLEPSRRQKIEQATHTFEDQLKAVLSNLTTNLSLSGAATQLEAALKQLQSSYVHALEPIECSS